MAFVLNYWPMVERTAEESARTTNRAGRDERSAIRIFDLADPDNRGFHLRALLRYCTYYLGRYPSFGATYVGQ